MDKYRIGVDLGGTKIESILLAPDRKEVFRKRVATPVGNNYDQILTSVHGLIQDTVQKVPAGRALGGLISVLDPNIVVIGGGLSNIDEIYAKGVKQVAKYAFHEKIHPPVLKNRLGDSSGVIGAALSD